MRIRYPETGVSDARLAEMKQVVQAPETMQMLVEIVDIAGLEGVAFVTQDDPGVIIFDEDSDVVFALGEDVFSPGVNEAPFDVILLDIIRQFHSLNAAVP